MAITIIAPGFADVNASWSMRIGVLARDMNETDRVPAVVVNEWKQ
jgi:hypothetical protein